MAFPLEVDWGGRDFEQQGFSLLFSGHFGGGGNKAVVEGYKVVLEVICK